jgi:hypothetical protein
MADHATICFWFAQLSICGWYQTAEPLASSMLRGHPGSTLVAGGVVVLVADAGAGGFVVVAGGFAVVAGACADSISICGTARSTQSIRTIQGDRNDLKRITPRVLGKRSSDADSVPRGD